MLLTLLFLGIFYHSNAQRNVILLIADDLGMDYLGFYENHQDTAPMPNVRKLLAKGVRFTNAWATPLCSSTRAGMLTGRYSFRTGVGAVVGAGGGALNVNEMSIPKMLKIFKPNGIATANIGKWHLQSPTPMSNLNNPNIMGYDHFSGAFIGQLNNYYSWAKVTNGVSGNVTTYATTETINDAINWIGSQNGKPFFLWLAFNAPHSPFHLPPANLHSYNTLSGTQQDINMNPKAYFKASVEALDTEIGRLFDYLEANNQLDSTDFVFMGDNGNARQTAQIANLDRAKGTIYEYGVHVPFIIAGPSVTNPGRVSDALVQTADLFATTVELFGFEDWKAQIAADKPVDSKSILPILHDQSTSIRPWSFTELFTTVPGNVDGKTMRNQKYKLMQFDVDGHQEFYNLEQDPGELTNLLDGSLSAVEQVNYSYLCHQMAELLGNPSYCNPAVAVSEIPGKEEGVSVFPNPFSANIQVLPSDPMARYELFNQFGQRVFSGTGIERQDFSKLPSGIYFLKVVGGETVFLRVVKG